MTESTNIKAAGIIAEYNPFHSGHAYQIAKTREAGYTHIVVVMSANVVQRGDIAILDAHTRARAAIAGGANLVIELPAPWSCSSAPDFARAGVSILKRLGVVSAISFGSECGDLQKLKACADAVENIDYSMLRRLMASGMTYPQAIERLTDNKLLSGANDTLAVEYIRAAKGSGLSAIAIKRTVRHDSPISEGCEHISASALRELMRGGNEGARLGYGFDAGEVASIENAAGEILFKLAGMSEQELMRAPYMSDGVAQRICRAAGRAASLTELYDEVKTRHITHARMRRAVILAALGVTSDEMAAAPPYARILAADAKGAQLLAACKDGAGIPFSSSLAKLAIASPQAKRTAFLCEYSSWLRDSASKKGLAGRVPQASRKFELTKI